MPFILRSTKVHPPGGFQYVEAATGMSINNPGFSFIDMVRAIRSHRKNNPKYKLDTGVDAISWDLEDYTVARIKNDPQWCLEVTEEAFQARRIKLPPGSRCGLGC